MRCRSQDVDFESRLSGELPALIWNSECGHHLWRILQEVVNNSIRHGQAGRVELQISPENKRIAFTLEDNGGGLRAGHVAGPGMRNIQYRANQLQAAVSWYPVTSGGTGFLLQIQLP